MERNISPMKALVGSSKDVFDLYPAPVTQANADLEEDKYQSFKAVIDTLDIQVDFPTCKVKAL